MKRGTLLLLWGLTLLWSFHSGRLDLLLRGIFHGLVGVTGLVLLMLGVALLLKREKQNERWRWPWLLSGVIAALVLGCVIAALVQTWLPRSWLLAVGGAPTASILALMLLAVVVSVCSSVDAFLALGFAAQITPGALLAFLLLGPVVDLKLAGLFIVLMRPRAILITAIGASLGVLLIGQWINLWLL